MEGLKTVKLFGPDHKLLAAYKGVKDLRYMGGCLHLMDRHHMILRVERYEYVTFTVEEDSKNGKRNDTV